MKFLILKLIHFLFSSLVWSNIYFRPLFSNKYRLKAENIINQIFKIQTHLKTSPSVLFKYIHISLVWKSEWNIDIQIILFLHTFHLIFYLNTWAGFLIVATMLWQCRET